jgi:hypothetical protein
MVEIQPMISTAHGATNIGKNTNTATQVLQNRKITKQSG